MKVLGGQDVCFQGKKVDAPPTFTIMNQNVCNRTFLMKDNEHVQSMVWSVPIFMSVCLMYTMRLGMSSGEEANVLMASENLTLANQVLLSLSRSFLAQKNRLIFTSVMQSGRGTLKYI